MSSSRQYLYLRVPPQDPQRHRDPDGGSRPSCCRPGSVAAVAALAVVVVAQASLSVAGVVLAVARIVFTRGPCTPGRPQSPQGKKPCRMACYCNCSNSTVPAAPGSGGPGDVCKWLSAPGGVVISVRAGAGRTVSGRPASELTFGGVSVEDDCCGGIEDVDADADVCTGLLARVARS